MGPLTIRDAQVQAMADRAPSRQMVAPCQPTWIEVRLIDADDHPVAGQRYRVRLPDSSLMEGVLDEQGRMRLDGIVPGTCAVSFPDIDAGEWRRV